MTLLSTSGFPPTAGAFLEATWAELQLFANAVDASRLASDYQQTVSLRNTGETIGVAGALFFGVGPAIQSGAPRGVDVNDYFPTHAASGSFM